MGSSFRTKLREITLGPQIPPAVLITGASGLLGSHLARRLAGQGHPLVAIVRPTSDAGPLERAGIRVARGELTDAGFVDSQVADAEIVLHCAAKLSNWGTPSEYLQGNLRPAEILVTACQRHPVRRLVHVSSIAVYGHPRPEAGMIDEHHPIGNRLLSFDRYNRSKIAAEQICQRLAERTVIIRPTWFIGPGDRYVVPALVRKLRKHAVWLLGNGDNLLNGLAVEDVAEGVIAAATADAAGGQVFNLASPGELTQREFLDQICDRISVPRVRRRMPVSVVRRYAWCVETFARLTRRRTPPPLTRHDLTVFTRPTRFETKAAAHLLDWRPHVPLADALSRTLDAYLRA